MPIELQPFYHDVKSTIVRPKQVVNRHPLLLGEVGAALGPHADGLGRPSAGCTATTTKPQGTAVIGASRRSKRWPKRFGISRWTFMRELKKPAARQFVRVQYRSRYDATRRQTVRISSLYHVAMDDPLVEEDRGRGGRAISRRRLCYNRPRTVKTHIAGFRNPGRQVDERPFTALEPRS